MHLPVLLTCFAAGLDSILGLGTLFWAGTRQCCACHSVGSEDGLCTMQAKQDNPHRLAADDPQAGGLQIRKKPGQLLTREQLKAQKVDSDHPRPCMHVPEAPLYQVKHRSMYIHHGMFRTVKNGILSAAIWIKTHIIMLSLPAPNTEFPCRWLRQRRQAQASKPQQLAQSLSQPQNF